MEEIHIPNFGGNMSLSIIVGYEQFMVLML